MRSLDGVQDPLSFTSEGKDSIDEDRTERPVSGLRSLSDTSFSSSSSPGGLKRTSRE